MYNNQRDLTKLKYYDVSQKNPIIIKLRTSEKKTLYHYTDNNGITGIINNNNFWVTQYNCLDDDTEIKYIARVLEGVIIYLYQSKEDYNMGISGQFQIYEIIIKVLEGQRDLYKYGVPVTDGSLFILSLTENSESKYLSDTYCGADQNILKIENNDDVFKGNNHMISFFSNKVEYELSKQMTILLEDINEFYTEIVTNLAQEEKIDYLEIVDTIKNIISSKVLCYSMFFKDKKYIDEEEHRIVFLVEENSMTKYVRYRMKRNKKIRYIEVKYNKSMVHLLE